MTHISTSVLRYGRCTRRRIGKGDSNQYATVLYMVAGAYPDQTTYLLNFRIILSCGHLQNMINVWELSSDLLLWLIVYF